MIKRKLTIILLIIISFSLLINSQVNLTVVKADELSDSVQEQLGNLDLDEFEDFFNNLNTNSSSSDFFTLIERLLKGEYDVDYNAFFDYLIEFVLKDVAKLLPSLISIIAIAIICSLVQGAKGNTVSEGVAEIVFFACISSIILLIFIPLLSIFENTKNTIENIAKLNEIMSPIIITLMVSIGANVSASVYKPIVVLFSSSVSNLFVSIILPLITLFAVFNAISCFSTSIKFNKFAELCVSVIKWIIGIIATIFSLFLSIQGLTSAHFDGISIKVAKYTISNSVPIIGGFLKDGFDIVIAGSILIKNAIGIAVVVALLSIILSPVIYISIFSLGLKLVSAIIEPIGDLRISNFCASMSKTVSFLMASLLTIGFLFFIMVIVITLSANAFI